MVTVEPETVTNLESQLALEPFSVMAVPSGAGSVLSLSVNMLSSLSEGAVDSEAAESFGGFRQPLSSIARIRRSGMILFIGILLLLDEYIIHEIL
jgi:hypothetical protein